MKKTVLIGNKEVEMLATGASPIYFKQCFHEDFKLERQKLYSMDNTLPEFSVGTEELFEKMGYIMSMQAEGKALEASFEGFTEWVDKFDPLDLEMSTQEIALLYHEQEKTTSIPKR